MVKRELVVDTFLLYGGHSSEPLSLPERSVVQIYINQGTDAAPLDLAPIG